MGQAGDIRRGGLGGEISTVATGSLFVQLEQQERWEVARALKTLVGTILINCSL